MFTIDQKLQDYIDKKTMKEERQKGATLTTIERENALEVEHAVFLNADLHWQDGNPDLDNFKAGFEFAQKSIGKEVHAVQLTDASYSGEPPELLVFIGKFKDIKKRLNAIPNVVKDKKKVLNDRFVTKEICKRCHLEYSKDHPHRGDSEDPATIEINMNQKWEQEHKVFCFLAGLWGDDLEIHSSPPSNCPYYMEHLTCAEIKDSSENEANKSV
jgi:hypothetical protein